MEKEKNVYKLKSKANKHLTLNGVQSLCLGKKTWVNREIIPEPKANPYPPKTGNIIWHAWVLLQLFRYINTLSILKF